MFPPKTAILLLAMAFSPGRVSALENPPPQPSPDGRHLIFNIGDTATGEIHFEIRTRQGKVLLNSKDKEKNGWPSTYATEIAWSKDSQFVLFRYNFGKYYGTALYSVPDQKLIDFSHIIDGWTVPVRWVSSRTFVIEHAGPRGGSSGVEYDEYYFRQTYRIRKEPFRVECVYTGPVVGDSQPPPGEWKLPEAENDSIPAP